MALEKLKKWIGTQAMTAFFDQLNDNVDATNAAIDEVELVAAKKHIYESGSNENGRYIKIDDGIVVMWGQVAVPLITSAGDYAIQWDHPVPLIDKPQLILSTIQSANSTSANSFDRVIINNQETTNQITKAILSTNKSTSYGFLVNFFAIGRWK